MYIYYMYIDYSHKISKEAYTNRNVMGFRYSLYQSLHQSEYDIIRLNQIFCALYQFQFHLICISLK